MPSWPLISVASAAFVRRGASRLRRGGATGRLASRAQSGRPSGPADRMRRSPAVSGRRSGPPWPSRKHRGPGKRRAHPRPLQWLTRPTTSQARPGLAARRAGGERLGAGSGPSMRYALPRSHDRPAINSPGGSRQVGGTVAGTHLRLQAAGHCAGRPQRQPASRRDAAPARGRGTAPSRRRP